MKKKLKRNIIETKKYQDIIQVIQETEKQTSSKFSWSDLNYPSTKVSWKVWIWSHHVSF